MCNETTLGTLVGTEPHPAALRAMGYVRAIPLKRLIRYQESFASCSLAGDREAEVCSETLDRYLSGGTFSDRYFLGLSWAIRDLEDAKNEK